MKLAITTDCILRCKYCFVKKNHRYMDLKTAKQTIDLLISSPGKNKILRIYGGEPLLNFKFIKKIAPYAFNQAKTRNKKLIVTLCTNAFLLTDDHVHFFKNHDFRLAISIDGDEKTHNRFRISGNPSGTYRRIERNLDLVFKNFDKKKLAAGLSVTPSTAHRLFENFKHVLNIGFDTVNIEPIYGFQQWHPKAQKEFFINMLKITKLIFDEIKKRNFIFLTTINRESKHGILTRTREGACLFFKSFEVYPDGEMGFSSFLLNSKNKQRYVVGNINSGIPEKYLSCTFSRKKKICRNCIKEYFSGNDNSKGENAVKIRDTVSLWAAALLKKKVKENKTFAEYLEQAHQHICF